MPAWELLIPLVEPRGTSVIRLPQIGLGTTDEDPVALDVNRGAEVLERLAERAC